MRPRPILFFARFALLLTDTITALAQKPELITQSGHSKAVNKVIFSPDGKTLASASDAFTIKLWDVNTGVELRTIMPSAGEYVTSIAFSPDGKTLASGSFIEGKEGASGVIKLWDVGTGAELRKIEEPCRDILFSPDG
jgi:WD40 repeat protein